MFPPSTRLANVAAASQDPTGLVPGYSCLANFFDLLTLR